MPVPVDASAPTQQAPAGALAQLPPAYFGMVMATGIVSVAAHLRGVRWLATGLFALNVVLYVALWLLYVLRAVRYPRRFFGDMIDHLRGPGYFTMVAGTCLLGSQALLLFQALYVALALGALAAVLWVGITYTIFTGFAVKQHKPSLQEGISGAWLLAVVASQSIAVLAALLGAHMPQPGKLELNFLALSMWSWGGMLYIWMMSLIFYRYNFFTFSPGDLSPPYWINMGAMAIATLAGSVLIQNSVDAPFLSSLLPFIKGFTVFYWATGTWWIPMLLLLGVWRHIYRRFPVHYDPLYWGVVFPLGMYATCTHKMVEVLGFSFMSVLAQLFFHVALAAWIVVFAGFARNLLRLRRAPSS